MANKELGLKQKLLKYLNRTPSEFEKDVHNLANYEYKGCTMADLLAIIYIGKAQKGDLDTFKFIMETLGEK